MSNHCEEKCWILHSHLHSKSMKRKQRMRLPGMKGSEVKNAPTNLKKATKEGQSTWIVLVATTTNMSSLVKWID